MLIPSFKDFMKNNADKCDSCAIAKEYRGIHNEKCGGECYRHMLREKVEEGFRKEEDKK